MADNTVLNSGSGGDTIATDDIAGIKHQRVKVEFGGDGVATDVSSTNPLPVQISDGTDTVAVSASNALSVEVTAALPAGDNNIGNVDIVTFPAEVHSADYDSGAGTDTTLAFGIAVPAAGGAAVVPGSATAGLKVDLGADNDVTVTSGSITETNSAAILADTANMDTNLGTIAGAVAAGQMQVDIVADGAGLALAANQLADDHSVNLVSEHTRNEAFAESIAIGGELDDTTPVAATEGNVSPVRITAQRALHANLRSNDGTELGTTGNPVIITDDGTALLVDGSAVTQPISAASLPLPTGAATETTLATVETNTDFGTVTGGGTEAGALRVTLASDSTGVVTVDNAGTFAVQSTLQTGSSLVGDVGLSGARTSGGTTPYYNSGTATETQIKGTAGQLYWISAINLSASVAWLQLFNNTAAAVTPGSTAPTNEFPIPTQGDTNGAGFNISIPNGIAYGTGITFFISTAKGGGAAVTANDVLLNIGYA